MSTREELIETLVRKRYVIAGTYWEYVNSEATADALIAEGWRKKPTVRRIADALHADDCPDDECEGGDLGHYERQAELVLALMDRGQ